MSEDTLNELACRIEIGGKTGLILENWRKSKILFKELEWRLNPEKVKHDCDAWFMWTANWSLTMLSNTPKICGFRMDNLIYDNGVSQDDILRPMVAVKLDKSIPRWWFNVDSGEFRELE